MEHTAVLKRVDHGSSNKPVEYVQAIASNNLKEIPHRYLRPEVHLDEVYDENHSLDFPIIDMSKLLDDQHFSHRDELAKLHSACKDWGFFQLINHEVPKEVVEKMKINAEELFQLPIEMKKAYATLPNSFEGYGQIRNQIHVASKDQKLDWGDTFSLSTRPIANRNMRMWPTHPASFRESLDKYSSELQNVVTHLLRFISANLGLNSQTLTNVFGDVMQMVKIIFYPPCMQASKVIGLSPHSDGTALTLLVQVNDVQSLQIKKNGKWLLVKPIPGAFIVNIGDIIEIMSNGEYKSIEHRVLVNPEKQRLSISAFHSPDLKALIGPLPELVKNSTTKYKTVSTQDYWRFHVNIELDGKNRIDWMKLDH